MAITRINHFEAKPGSAAELRAFLTSVVGVIQSTAGCRSVRLLEALDAPQRLVIVEVWDSVAAHQAAAGAIPAAQLEMAMALFAAPPRGEYYREAEDGAAGDRGAGDRGN